MGIIKKIKEFKWGYILIALITAIIGICLFVFNNASVEALAIAIGVVIIIGAILIALFSMASGARGFYFGIKMVFSVAMLIAGIVTIIARIDTMNVMVGIFGLEMIIDGSFKFHTTAMAKRFKLWCWVVLLILSSVLIAGGYLTVRVLNIEMSETVYVLGCLFVVDSIANLLSAFYISAYEKRNEDVLREKIYNEIDVESGEIEAYEEEIYSSLG
ncbi:MAG: DUF308 domain-containing protein [Clostridia bacterium]|nr:DUF308 domain-containing protein [Clostridia bacterium]